MSARKRCRKSKLVPRECAEEEEIHLQSPLKKLFIPVKTTKRKKTETKVEKKNDIKSVLEKINAAARQDSEEAKALEEPARKFEVDIQIETCDEDMNPVGNLEENKSILQNHLDNLDMSPLPSIELKIEDILKATDDIIQTATNNTDKCLSLYVKNTIGSMIQNVSPRSHQEEGILKALEEWKLWSNHAKYVNRTRPVFYKCYICKVAWWHLSDFRDHITQHENVTVTFEQTNHESNIVASSSNSKFTFENIFAEGNCSLCGRDYHYHKVQTYDFNNIVFGQYVSRKCQRTFFNCYYAMIHANNCEFCDVGDNECQVCSVKFEKLIDLEEHLVLCHSVRSDEPAAVIGGKTCKCSQRFISKVHHVCVNKDPVFQCFDCYEGFYNKIMIKKHSAMSNHNFTCNICNESLNKYCKKYIHLMKHTDKFMMVAKCMQCPDFNLFVDEEDAFQHKRSKHGQDSKRNLYFPKILVPISCIIDSLRTELLNVVKKEKPDNQDDTIEKQEETMTDIKIESDFVKEEPEEAENEEDDEECNLVIKEEPLELNEPYNEIYEESITEKEISVKEENFDEEEEDYQGDIIKIDVKCEATDQFGVKENVSNDQTEKFYTDGSDNETLSPVLVGGRMKNRIYKCNKCGYQARHKKFKEHVESVCGKSTYNKKTYNCTKCETVFPSLGKYLVHFTKHGVKEMACPECLRQFQTVTQLGQHLYTHIKQNFVRVKLISHESYYKLDFQCKQCSEIVTMDQFFDHWQIHLGHNPENKLRIKEEIQQDLNPDGSIAHEPLPGCLPEAIVKECLQHIMMKVPKECNYCHRKFTRVYGCKRHIIEHLLADAYAQKPVFGALRCQICAIGFPTPEKYKQHMRDHASLPVYKCELCDRTFSDSSNFTKHKKVHNYKVLVCDLCGKKFQAKSSLIKHLVKHEITTPITCNLCNRIFYFESSYRRHVRYAHDKVTFGFRCVICNERFDSLKYKWDHMWQVHKERNQKADCPICLESFRKYADVKFHARMLHGIEVSVLSMKNAASGAMNLDTYFKAPRIRLGDNETLVVYESE
ncbi:zinc finger protein 236-like isoform X1 [Spodoptera litura]|uniref:Zinc finger protein 236-like isoform X1 n=1 Tax=Spodoptera litura TaxID=69820 RepID=A0A9J7EQT7_SPOLT|nr:zinc finger protein 236-like isoform X1 [Spodoptera litura]